MRSIPSRTPRRIRVGWNASVESEVAVARRESA
jgi:hypothetical protein